MAPIWGYPPFRNKVAPVLAMVKSRSSSTTLENRDGKDAGADNDGEKKKPNKVLMILEKLPFTLGGLALISTVLPNFTYAGEYSMFSHTLGWAETSVPTYFASCVLWISMTCHIMSVVFDAIARHEAEKDPRKWTRKDFFKAGWTSFATCVLVVILGIGSNASTLTLIAYGVAAPCCTFLAHFLLKGMLAAVVFFKGQLTRSFLVKVEVLLVCIFIFQVFVSYFRTRAAIVYPYQKTHDTAFSIMLATGNNSQVGCDSETDFRASFQLPFEYTYWGITRKLECPDDPLCGYVSWFDLCTARSISPLASSIWFNTEHLLTFPLVLCICPLILFGSGRIRQSYNGDLDLSGLLNPRIILSLAILIIAGLCFLWYLMLMFVETPLYLLGNAPIIPVSATCGLGSTCFTFLLQGFLMYGLELACLLLLSVDSFERIARRLYKSPKYFISYKTEDRNDGIVRDILHHLPPGGSHWLDKRAKDVSTKGMRMGIKGVDAFMMVLSPNYFQSEFCCMEVHRALTLKKPIRPVWNNTAYKVGDVMKWVPKELHRLKDITFLPVSEDFEHMKVDLKRIQGEPAQYFDGEVPEQIGDFRFDKESRSIIAIDAAPSNEVVGTTGELVPDIESGKQDVQHSVQVVHATDQECLLATEM